MIVNKTNLARDIFFLVLESIGIHGIVGVLGGILLFLGFIKLMCGGIVCCRKTKAQEHHDNLIKKGVDPKCKYHLMHALIALILDYVESHNH